MPSYCPRRDAESVHCVPDTQNLEDFRHKPSLCEIRRKLFTALKITLLGTVIVCCGLWCAVLVVVSYVWVVYTPGYGTKSCLTFMTASFAGPGGNRRHWLWILPHLWPHGPVQSTCKNVILPFNPEPSSIHESDYVTRAGPASE